MHSQAAPRVDLAASVRALVTTPPDPDHFAAATAAMARLDPERTTAAVAAAPAPQNAASDAIVSGYQFLRYWVTYGVQLADYVLGFVPFGYAIADQVNIFYYNLILPISDSVVYNLIVPVVNDPLNLASYIDGVIAVAQTSVNAAINTGVAEFNYFFGWLIPPLPPRPLAVEAALKDEAPTSAEIQDLATRHDASATDAGPSPTPGPDAPVEPTPTSQPSPTPEPTETVEPTHTVEPTQTAEPTQTTEPTTTRTPTTPELKPPTTSTDGTVQAQGEVRGSTTTTGTTTTTTTGATTATGAGTTSGPTTGTDATSTDTPAAKPPTPGELGTGPATNGED